MRRTDGCGLRQSLPGLAIGSRSRRDTAALPFSVATETGRDLANFRAALAQSPATDAFVSAAAPGAVSIFLENRDPRGRGIPSALHGSWNSLDNLGMLDAIRLSQQSRANDAAAEALREASARTVPLDDGIHECPLAEMAGCE